MVHSEHSGIRMCEPLGYLEFVSTVTSGSNRLVRADELASAVQDALAREPYAGELPPLWDGRVRPPGSPASLPAGWLPNPENRCVAARSVSAAWRTRSASPTAPAASSIRWPLPAMISW